MKKYLRIKRGDEFEKIIKSRKYVTSGSFVVYTREKIENYARVGISVPKKLGNAVKRNKMKRQMREMIAQTDVSTWNIDIIIIVRNNYLKQSFADNRKDLEKVLKNVKIRCDI